MIYLAGYCQTFSFSFTFLNTLDSTDLQFALVLSVQTWGCLKLEVLDWGLHEVDEGAEVTTIEARVTPGKKSYVIGHESLRFKKNEMRVNISNLKQLLGFPLNKVYLSESDPMNHKKYIYY